MTQKIIWKKNKPNQTKNLSIFGLHKGNSTLDYLCLIQPAKMCWEESCSINLLQMHFIHIRASVYNFFLSWASQYPKVTVVSSSWTGGIFTVCLQLCKPFHLVFLSLFSGSWVTQYTGDSTPQIHVGWSIRSLWFGIWGFTSLFLSLPNAISFLLPPDTQPNTFIYLDVL